MKNAKTEEIEFETHGAYLGQCRHLFNILEQWDGKKWRRAPDVIDRDPGPRGKMHFDVDDYGRG